MEETETVPALLTSPSITARNKNGNNGGGGSNGDDGGGVVVTVTISTRDPLRVQMEGAAVGGTQKPVPSLEQEISGADVYPAPPAPTHVMDGKTGGNGHVPGKNGASKQGRRWIRITRGADVESQGGEEEVFQLKEVISR